MCSPAANKSTKKIKIILNFSKEGKIVLLIDTMGLRLRSCVQA